MDQSGSWWNTGTLNDEVFRLTTCFFSALLSYKDVEQGLPHVMYNNNISSFHPSKESLPGNQIPEIALIY